MHGAIINGAAQVNIMVFHAMESLNLTPTRPSTHLVIHDGSDTIPELYVALQWHLEPLADSDKNVSG